MIVVTDAGNIAFTQALIATSTILVRMPSGRPVPSHRPLRPLHAVPSGNVTVTLRPSARFGRRDTHIPSPLLSAGAPPPFLSPSVPTSVLTPPGGRVPYQSAVRVVVELIAIPAGPGRLPQQAAGVIREPVVAPSGSRCFRDSPRMMASVVRLPRRWTARGSPVRIALDHYGLPVRSVIDVSRSLVYSRTCTASARRRMIVRTIGRSDQNRRPRSHRWCQCSAQRSGSP